MSDEMKKGQSHTPAAEWHRGVSKPFVGQASNPCVGVSIWNTSLLSVLPKGGEIHVKSVLITRMPDNHSMLITEPVFLFDYPDTVTVETHPETEMGRTAIIPLQSDARLKKKKLKQRKQLEMAESPYLRHNHKSSFCYILFGTFWFSSWGKKKFRIQTYLHNINIKCVNIYI